jgi:hypothetical protein
MNQRGGWLRKVTGDRDGPRPRASRRDNIVMSLLSCWFSTGLTIDAWAHSIVPELETFFTPWHAVFYSGFTATAAWVLAMIVRNVRQGRSGLGVIPVGYGWTVAALAVFGLSTIADGVWHTLWGIERTINILFSPSHLIGVASLVIILTSPLRAMWSAPDLPGAPSFRQFWPAALSTGMAAAQVMLFLGYGDALTYGPGAIVAGLSTFQQPAATLASSMIISNVVLLAPVLFLARRWRLPFWTVTTVWLPVIALAGAETEARFVGTLLTFVVAALLVDLLARWLRPTADRPGAFWLFGGSAAFVTWALYIAVASITMGSAPSIIELWTGAPVVAGLVGWLLAVLMLPEARQADAAKVSASGGLPAGDHTDCV